MKRQTAAAPKEAMKDDEANETPQEIVSKAVASTSESRTTKTRRNVAATMSDESEEGEEPIEQRRGETK